MQELIKIKKSKGNKDVVSARELCEFLGIKDHVSSWFKYQVERAMLVDGVDFSCLETSNFANGRDYKSIDYAITLSSAKEIAMLNGGEKGKQARLYFIECERLSKHPIQQPVTQALPTDFISALEQLLLSKKSELALEEKVKELEPKGKLFDMAMSSRDTLDMSEVAKTLCLDNLGRNNMFQKLREKGVLRENNEPYQSYVNNGWFKIVERPFNKPDGKVGIGTKTVVFQKGLDGIRKILTPPTQ